MHRHRGWISIALLLASAQAVQSVEPGEPSKTSIWIGVRASFYSRQLPDLIRRRVAGSDHGSTGGSNWPGGQGVAGSNPVIPTNCNR